MNYLTEKQQTELTRFVNYDKRSILVVKGANDCEDGIFTHYGLDNLTLGLDEHDELCVCIMQPFDSDLIQVYTYCVHGGMGLESTWCSRVMLDYTIYETIVNAVVYYKSIMVTAF